MPDNRKSEPKVNTVVRALTKTYVEKKIAELKSDPERSIRNLVDLALNLSTGRFQKHFFETAQTMLSNPESGYYKLIPDIVEHVDSERLTTFGVNLGYNSLTAGAKIIRKQEAKGGFNVPWVIALAISKETYDSMESAYRSLIEQGKTLGIYSWIFYVQSGAALPLSLMRAHPDCAFLLIAGASEITEDFLAQAEDLNNLMISVKYEKETPHAADIFAAMRSREMLYSAFVFYDMATASKETVGTYLAELDSMHPAFTFFAPLLSPASCHSGSFSGPETETAVSGVYDFIEAQRSQQNYASIPLDLYYDLQLIDGVISNDSCSLFFDRNGNLCRECSNTSIDALHLYKGYADTLTERLNFKSAPLLSILQTAYKKSRLAEPLAL